MAAGTMGMAYNINTMAQEIDGDVVKNPWEHLFKDENNGNGDVIIDTTTENNGSENSTIKSQSAKKLKKQLKTKIVSATKRAKKTKKAKIVLKKNKKAVSYQIRYSTSKKFKKYKTKTFKKNKIFLKKLKAGKKYYIKARAVGKLNGVKIYGKWTKRKAIKVKNKIKK